MDNSKLFDYIKQQLQAGKNKEEIRKILINKDWDKQEVEATLLKSSNPATPKQELSRYILE